MCHHPAHVRRLRRRASSSAICEEAINDGSEPAVDRICERPLEARRRVVVATGGEVSLSEVLDQHGFAVGAGVRSKQLLVLGDGVIVLAEVTSDVGAQGSPPPVVAVVLEQGRQLGHRGVRITAPQRDEHLECRVGAVALPEASLIRDDGSQRRWVDVPSVGPVVHRVERTTVDVD